MAAAASRASLTTFRNHSARAVPYLTALAEAVSEDVIAQNILKGELTPAAACANHSSNGLSVTSKNRTVKYGVYLQRLALGPTESVVSANFDTSRDSIQERTKESLLI